MSNLTQFFVSIPSTADTATPITGTTMQALTAGDGVKLGDNGQFAKTGKSGMKKGIYAVDATVDRSGVANDGLNLGDNSNYMRYSPWENLPRGIVLSDDTYIQLFVSHYNNSGSNYFGFRSFVTTNSESHMHFKDAKLHRAAATSNAYYHYGCQMREMFKDDNYIYVSALIYWKQTNNYDYGRHCTIKMNRATKVMEVHTKQNDQLVQYSEMSRGLTGGGGSSGIYANGVVVTAVQEGNATSDLTGRLAISSHVYNTASPSNLTEVGTYDGGYYDYNYGVSDLLLHDETSRTFLSFEAPLNSNNSKLVKKHVFAANGAITTTTVAAAFTLSNFSNAITQKYFRVVKVSAGVYAAIFAETNNVWSIQKFTWDGNTTLTQTGSRIDLTLPTGLTIESAGATSLWYYNTAYHIAGDEGNLIIDYSAANGTKNANQNVSSIDLVAGTLNFSVSTFGFGDSGGHLHGGCFIAGKNVTIVLRDGDDYDEFHYEKYNSGFFTHTNQTKEVIGIALADAVQGATDASIALLDGLKSTTALPAGTFIEKNGQYYLLDVPTTLGDPEIKVVKQPVYAGLYGTYNDGNSVSVHGPTTTMIGTGVSWIGSNNDQRGNTGFSTYKGSGGAVWNDQRFDHNIFPQRFSAACASSATTTIVSISGKGRLLHRMVYANGHNTTYTSGWELWIDGVKWYEQVARGMNQGTAGYYTGLHFEFLTGLPYLDFDSSMEFKCVSPTTNNVTNYCFFRLATRG